MRTILVVNLDPFLSGVLDLIKVFKDPKVSNLRGFAQTDLDLIAMQLNQRPRKTLGFNTHIYTLMRHVALTG